MFTHLQTREYYEDQYDNHTVERCRRMIAFKPEITDDDFKDQNLSPEQLASMKKVKEDWSKVAMELATFSYAGERYNDKERYIDEWMLEDREHDERLAKIEAPKHVRCRECLGTSLRLISKDEYSGSKRKDKHERLLFMYKCDDCDTNTAYFDNGEQYKVEPTRCPECYAAKPDHVTTKGKHKYTITYTCKACGHIWKEVMDFTPEPPKPPDPTYIEERKLYCYSDKVQEYARSIRDVVPLLRSLDAHREKQADRETHKELYAAVEDLEKLKVSQVIERLKPLIEKAGYGEVRFAEPEIGRDVFVPFSCLDTKAEREEWDSSKTLKRIVTKALGSTNWRLMSEGVHYRLGYLNGKLRAYEREEDLKRLVEQRFKKQRQSPSSKT